VLFKLAWRNIWRNKTRSIITIIAIMVAVLLSNIMESIQQGMWEKMLNTTMSFTGYVQIQNPDFWEEQSLDNCLESDPSIIDIVKENRHVKYVTPRLQSFSLSAYKDMSRAVQVIGLNPDDEEPILDMQTKLDTGALLTNEDDGIIIGEGLAKYYKVRVGDTLSLIGQGHYGESANGNFPVKGIIKFGAPDMNSRLVVMPYKLAEYHFSAQNLVTSYNLVLNNVNQARKVADDIRKRLDGKNVRVMPWQEMMPELEQAYQADTGGAVLFFIILYVIISFGIFGTILMMTEERMYEFGVMISIGMKRMKLIIMIFLEVLFLSILSVVLGTGISYPIMYYFYSHPIPMTGEAAETMHDYGFEAVIQGSINPVILKYNAIAILLISVVIVMYPLLKIIRLNPIKAMKR